MRKEALIAGLCTTVACLWAQVQMHAHLETEPNNFLGAAQQIPTEVDATTGFVVWDAAVLPAGDHDFYQFRVRQAGTYSIRVDTNLDLVLRLYNAHGELVAESDNAGNPDLPLARFAPGLTRTLSAGTYVVMVLYNPSLGFQGQARYALRVFPGTAAPDYDLTEPNDTPSQAVDLGGLSDGELTNSTYAFLSYRQGDIDVYKFTLHAGGLTLAIRTQTYLDTAMRVVAPDGRVYENDNSDWDALNPLASAVEILLAPSGTYYVFVRAAVGWGGYYRLRISALLPEEVVLQDGDAQFRLRELGGDPARNPFNNADWVQQGIDHFYQMGWWYRIEGAHPREYTLSGFRHLEQDRPNRVRLHYWEPEGLRIAAQYELKRTSDGGSVLYADLLVINFHSQERVVHLFHFADPDVGGRTHNHAHWDADRVLVRTPITERVAARLWLTALTPYTRWEVSPYPTLLERLLDEAADTLSNGSLPFEGDFTGAFQWSLTLAPFEWRVVSVHYALNTTFVPSSADVNRDGCVNNSDLLVVLVAFGQSGLWLEGDVDGNGVINNADLVQVLLQFGGGCR